MPERRDHVSGAEIVNQPIDATSTPATGVLLATQRVAPAPNDESYLTGTVDVDVIHFDIQAAPDNAGNIILGTETEAGIILAAGQSWACLTRFDASNLKITIEEEGDEYRAVWFEREVV